MSLYDPMPQAEEPDEEPREPRCDHCYGEGVECQCPGVGPWFADEDEPAPMSGPWVEDI